MHYRYCCQTLPAPRLRFRQLPAVPAWHRREHCRAPKGLRKYRVRDRFALIDCAAQDTAASPTRSEPRHRLSASLRNKVFCSSMLPTGQCSTVSPARQRCLVRRTGTVSHRPKRSDVGEILIFLSDTESARSILTQQPWGAGSGKRQSCGPLQEHAVPLVVIDHDTPLRMSLCNIAQC